MHAPISTSSKMCYLRNLRTLQKLVTSKTLDEILLHPESVISLIKNRYENSQTRKAMAAAVKAVYKYVPDLRTKHPKQFMLWNAFHAAEDKVISTRVLNAEPSDRERENWVEWCDILAKENELSRLAFGSTEHLLLSMYTHIEPLRQDFGDVAIIPEMPRSTRDFMGNHLIVPDTGPATLVLQKYKTEHAYGVLKRQLTGDLTSIIRASLRLQPRGFLFVDARGNPYTKSNSFTKFSNRVLERLFHKKCTVSMLRHSFISNIDFNQSTPMQLLQTCRNMGHSLVQQQMYRRNVLLDSTPREANALPAPQKPAPLASHTPQVRTAVHTLGISNIHTPPSPPSAASNTPPSSTSRTLRALNPKRTLTKLTPHSRSVRSGGGGGSGGIGERFVTITM